MKTKNLNEHTPLQQLFTGARLFSETRGAKGSSAVYSKKFAALCINVCILLKCSANRFELNSPVNLPLCHCVRNLTERQTAFGGQLTVFTIGTLVIVWQQDCFVNVTVWQPNVADPRHLSLLIVFLNELF